MLIELTVLSRDELNGKKIAFRHDFFKKIMASEMPSDTIHLIGQTTGIPGTAIWFHDGGMMMVKEKYEDLFEQINKEYARHGRESE